MKTSKFKECPAAKLYDTIRKMPSKSHKTIPLKRLPLQARLQCWESKPNLLGSRCGFVYKEFWIRIRLSGCPDPVSDQTLNANKLKKNISLPSF
jgi:hypothetical protein